MSLKPLLLLLLTLVLVIQADNDTCPTEVTRRNAIQCFTYPRSRCVTETQVFSTNTSLFIGNSTVVDLESELRVFRVLNKLLANFTGMQLGCEGFYQTLICLYLYTPCFEEKPLRFCEESCIAIKESQCTINSNLFTVVAETLNDSIFSEVNFEDCTELNQRVDGYPEIESQDYSAGLGCTYVGLPGAKNAVNGQVKLVTDDTHDSTNIYATSSDGVVQVLNLAANIWGDVCIEEGMSDEEREKIAHVVCNSIDYPGGHTESFIGGPSTSSGYYMINQLSCNGNESQLSDCIHNGYDYKNCAIDRRLHVSCSKELGSLRLDNEQRGDHMVSGVPIIQLTSGVAEFCADTFTMETGNVICNYIDASFPNLTITYSGQFENEDIELATFNCDGGEARILQCEQVNISCPSNERVLIFCENLEPDTRIFINLTPMESVILGASIIILILLLTICFVIIMFCRYRNTTNKKIQGNLSNTLTMRTMNTSVSITGQYRLPQTASNGSTATRPIIDYDYNPRGYAIENKNNSKSLPKEESTVSPIQNYMVTTLGAESLPTDVELTKNYITEYCGADICDYFIPMDKLELGDKIGEGAFGVVYKGKILEKEEAVAVKTLKDSFKDQELKELLLECAVLKDLQHANIVGLLALTYNGRRPYAIIPFMAKGDLKAYLKSVRVKALNSLELPEELSEKLLARISLDITRGMEYLTYKRYVHRDLAARNCVLDEDYSVKVSDFGLSREIYVDDYYRHVGAGEKLPAKWMSPESLDDSVYDEKTDVWSFGVVLWEIYSLGRNPYPGVDNHEISVFLKNGKRMERPKMCPVDIYDLMQYCWQGSPDQRPTFSIITNYLETLNVLEISQDLHKSHVIDCSVIKEEEDKLRDLEYIEEDIEKRRLHRQDAVSIRTPTPYTACKVIRFEHLASRIDKSDQKAFMLKCAKSVSMDSNKFRPCEHYIIPHLSMSIPIKDEEHRERTRSLNTVRIKYTRQEKINRHTWIGSVSGEDSDKYQPIESPSRRLMIPPPRQHKNKTRGKLSQQSSTDERREFTKTSNF
ncbi:Protein tyrosine kinase [Oopsacas minuta]|uniref:Protein tyrosine kinase n=1 Tax=Oopsacas minuta TaxID=111878 RepID=A0AAV7JNM0_9METZ|nr:Protein tyrosine kinase [Oopsacas minuta]